MSFDKDVDQELNTMYDDDKAVENQLTQQDIKIKPDFYIHIALVGSQRALELPDIRAGMAQYKMITNRMVMLARSSNRLPQDFDAQIEAYKQTQEYAEAEGDAAKSQLVCDKKQELVLGEQWVNKPVGMRLKV